jgi:hypothetical protein
LLKLAFASSCLDRLRVRAAAAASRFAHDKCRMLAF